MTTATTPVTPLGLFEWSSTDLIGLGQELQRKIAQLRQEQKRQRALKRDTDSATGEASDGSQGDAATGDEPSQVADQAAASSPAGSDEAASEETPADEEKSSSTNEDEEDLDAKLESQRKAIEASFAEQLQRLRAQGPLHVTYDASQAGIDLDRLVYSGDRAYLTEMLADPRFAFAVNQAISERKPYNARKELLTKGLKLTRGMAPLVHDLVSRCAQALKIQHPIEVFVYHDANYNASCFPPRKDKILLAVTSSLLENFTEDELAFVIGHEIGHFLFEHVRYPIDSLLGYLDPTPLDAMRVFSWKRNAEVTADRVGLVCCQNFPAAASSFFKLSSGVTGERVRLMLDEFLEQLADLQAEMIEQNDPEIWYSSHPFNPLRIKALDIFARSETYRRLIGKPVEGAVRDDVSEQRLAELMRIMEPVYLSTNTDTAERSRRFMVVAGMWIAGANEVIDDREKAALLELLGEHADADRLADVAAMSREAIEAEVHSLAKEMRDLLNMGPRMQMVQDLAIISYADGSLEESELDCLHAIADALEVSEHFVDHVLITAKQGVD